MTEQEAIDAVARYIEDQGGSIRGEPSANYISSEELRMHGLDGGSFWSVCFTKPGDEELRGGIHFYDVDDETGKITLTLGM